MIEDHEAGVLGKAREADHTADAATAPAKARFEAEQARLAEEAAKAARGDPTGAAKPVGPVSRSYYDNLPENP